MTARAPLVWAIVGDKLGDNAQLQAITSRLPWPVQEKRLTFRAAFRRGKPPFFASLYHVDRKHSAALEPPWPELVLTIGRRPAMAALWVRRRSGAHTKLVILGRPKRDVSEFDLVISPPQYDLPMAPNVIHLGLPLLSADAAKIEQASQRFAPLWASWPRPLTAVSVGGQTAPYRLDTQFADRLMDALPTEGTTYLATSRRTGEAVEAQLRLRLRPSQHLYAFRAGDSGNPYHALLGLADRFVVTGDSVSMLVEVARLKKPLCIAPLPPDERWLRRGVDAVSRAFGTGYVRELPRLHRVLMLHGCAGQADLSAGRLAFSASTQDMATEVDGVVARVRELLELRESSDGAR